MAGFSLIKIFSDTNILHASQAHLLLPSKISEYISEHKRIESMELKWFLSKMVIKERRHQMLQAALNLEPKINELEKLLGHALGINEEVMAERVDTKIHKTISELGIEVCDIDCNDVNWRDIIDRSATRQAPFEASGEKEKGFRDAIIATTFLQELSKSPTTPRSCLLVFISGDQRLRDYIKEKTETSKNVRLLETLDELKSLLNAIASEITEEFLGELLPKAKNIFYDFDKKDGLYNKEKILGQINEKFSEEINGVLSGYPQCRREVDGIILGDQTFIGKTGQTVVWNRVVKLKFKIIKNAGGLLGLATLWANAPIGAIPAPPPQEGTVVTTGESLFSVEWQHQVTTKGSISKPKINKIEFVGHNMYADE